MNYHYYKPNHLIDLPAHKNIVLVGGCFDILHYGHIQFLEKSRECGDYLIVALEPDERIIKYKKRQPIHNQEERAGNLRALRCVDHVILLPMLSNFDDYLLFVKNCRPNIITTTSNDCQINNKKLQAATIGAELKIVMHPIEGFSSSGILEIW